MQLFIEGITLFLLCVLTYQDFKERAISWIILPLLFICFIAQSYNKVPWNTLTFFFGINIGFIILQLCSVSLYFFIKRKSFKNIIDKEIGIGDVLFFVVITVAFSPVNFIVFYIATLVLTLITYLVLPIFNKKVNKEIPLAGIMAMGMGLVLTWSFFNRSFSLYSDTTVLSLITFQ